MGDRDVDTADCRNDRIARTVGLGEAAQLDPVCASRCVRAGRFRPRCAQEPPSVPCLPNECPAPAGIGLSPGSAFVKAVLPPVLTPAEPPATVCGAMRRIALVLVLLAAPRVRLDASSSRRGQPVRAAAGPTRPWRSSTDSTRRCPDHQRRRRPADPERSLATVRGAPRLLVHRQLRRAALAPGPASPRELDASTRLHEAVPTSATPRRSSPGRSTLERSSLLVTAASEALGTVPLLAPGPELADAPALADELLERRLAGADRGRSPPLRGRGGPAASRWRRAGGRSRHRSVRRAPRSTRGCRAARRTRWPRASPGRCRSPPRTRLPRTAARTAPRPPSRRRRRAARPCCRARALSCPPPPRRRSGSPRAGRRRACPPARPPSRRRSRIARVRAGRRRAPRCPRSSSCRGTSRSPTFCAHPARSSRRQ